MKYPSLVSFIVSQTQRQRKTRSSLLKLPIFTQALSKEKEEACGIGF